MDYMIPNLDFLLPTLSQLKSQAVSRLDTNPTTTALLAAGFVLAAFWCGSTFQNKRKFARRRKGLPLPPGPKGTPLLGNLLQIPQEHSWKVYAEWKEEYGDIIYLEALGQRIIVLNSLEDIEALLSKRATNYSDRVWSPIIGLMRVTWGFSVMNYGQEWRERRKVFHQFFHNNKRNIHPVIEEEIKATMKKLGASSDGGSIIRDELRSMFGMIILRVTYGSYPKQSSGSDEPPFLSQILPKAQALVLGFTEYSTPGRLLVSTFPSMRLIPSWFPGAGWKRALNELADLSDYVYEKPWEDTLERAKKGVQSEYPSFSTELIQEFAEEGTEKRKRQELVAKDAAGQAYAAGSDASVATVYALVLALAMHPEVQRKAQREIDAILNTDERLPTFEDLARLPYIHAIVKEVERWHTTVPLAVPHLSTRDDVYKGYFIPEKTIIMPNTWAVMHDPTRFPEPDSFKPERYLTKDGKIVTSVLDSEDVAFGYGRRICPGREMASDTLLLLALSLLACFDIKPGVDKATGTRKKLKMETPTGLIAMPMPFDCEVTPRSPKHLSLLKTL
ncbi:hypothetical protein CC1G_02512 [Coprinopsis cinerea okayama7|uniref:Cytochrome P450 n=1 Tax=Coprinopsis cinerea (strain Okayama-7 / 130 / ATCC MYA-4618 / FGSC 9003) TaxID=240176 RepID=A8NBQ2_COPC7|nr:hypothetical protein CC1G_02512 [Coprinopsis cinerea okayama7\|eukprot:XP_001832250.1 hypothetical protein CC1G_02512 [Coprinopsis cinerea okayama7\